MGVTFVVLPLSCAFVFPSRQHVRQRPGLYRVLGLAEQPAERGARLAGGCSATYCPECVQPPSERERWDRLAT